MSKFIDSIKHAIVEDDPDPKPSTVNQAHPEARISGPPASSRESITAPSLGSASYNSLGEETEHVYKKILAKTDFQSTPVAGTIHKYLDPLSAIPAMDERTKFKTAVVQARAQEGLTQEKILATFDGLKVALQNEQESFAATAEATKDQEITNRQQKVQQITDAIAAKQKEISQLQQQLSQMSTDLVEAQGKIQRAESQFTIAAQRRAVEIDQEKAKYVSLLQG
jgi:predicted RNase H-like nuclease (RuvC/YqgF family)